VIDNFSILFSTVMTVIVIVRAALQDRRRAWFAQERAPPDA
jgi:hypothetical protein